MGPASSKTILWLVDTVLYGFEGTLMRQSLHDFRQLIFTDCEIRSLEGLKLAKGLEACNLDLSGVLDF